MRRIVTVLLGLAALCALGLPANARPIGLDDLESLVSVNSPRFSPDGRHIVVRVGRVDYEENQYANQLVLIDVKSGAQRELTHERPKVRRPRWSPDGKHLAFIDSAENAKGKKKNQIFVMPMAGGESRQITHSDAGVRTYEWMRDGSGFLAIISDDDPEEPEGNEKHNKSFVVGHHDYQKKKVPTTSSLWKVPLDGESMEIDIGDTVIASDLMARFMVSPDGFALAYVGYPTGKRGDLHQARMYVLELPTGKQREMAEPMIGLAGFAFGPNGKKIAFSKGNSTPYFSSHTIHVAEPNGRRARNVTAAIDRHISAAHWMPDGRSLIVGAADRDLNRLWQVPLKGSPRVLDLGDLNVNGGGTPTLHLSANGALAFTATKPTKAAELYVMDSLDAAPRQLTNFNAAFDKLDLGRAHEVSWKGHDGFEENGILIYPPNFDPKKKYPLVLKIHGGPMGATVRSFDVHAQLLAAQGWVVFGPNYRGSNNLGNAYQSAVIGDAGEGPGKDVMAGIEVVKKMGFVDESRIATSGWSYGGYMTSWLIGNYPDVWAAAIAGAPVTDYVDQYSLSDVNTGFGWGFPQKPWTEAGQQMWRTQSPIAHVHKAKAPTLILCDTGDLRVPITESYKLFHALDDHDVPVEFVAYPVSGHFPPDPIHRMDVYRRWIDWIAHWFDKQ